MTSILPRTLTKGEAAIVRWLLTNAVVADGADYSNCDIDRLRVVGGCDCGCCSIDFVANTTAHPIADAVAVYSDGVENGLLLFGGDGEIVRLELIDNPVAGHRLPQVADLQTWDWNVQKAIDAAESILPGEAAADDDVDPRWQAIVAVGAFIRSEPEAVWAFIERWGVAEDDDLRAAVSTCLLEHLLEHHFDAFITRVEQLARADRFFANTVSICWKLGQTEEPVRARRLDRLIKETRNRARDPKPS